MALKRIEKEIIYVHKISPKEQEVINENLKKGRVLFEGVCTVRTVEVKNGLADGLRLIARNIKK